MSSQSYSEKYTHPELRDRLKEEIKASDKGGEPGQWSARKAQLLKQEYEKHGGGYRGGKDEEQRSLTEWSNEEWQTKDGEVEARDSWTGETKRYLPKEAWEKMSIKEAERTDQRKREASREGRQFVENTGSAKEAREESLAPPLADYDELSVGDIQSKVKGLSDEEVERVREYERRHRARRTLLRSLDARLAE
ncbi:hypothetical protein [Rubrobacter aplysinae]|uniref:hypothetical protein n=1 Tax=Rubrobacter aplysinae TaxID=909625 RepID=UPI00064B88E5|nr:hypothetical protein [Rubrobacter aplysinae]